MKKKQINLEPRLIEVIILRWACAVPGHQHKSKETAAKCIEKTQHPPVKAKTLREQAKKRRQKICAMYEEKGMTYQQIAEKMGITKERARQIVIKEQHYREWEHRLP